MSHLERSLSGVHSKRSQFEILAWLAYTFCPDADMLMISNGSLFVKIGRMCFTWRSQICQGGIRDKFTWTSCQIRLERARCLYYHLGRPNILVHDNGLVRRRPADLQLHFGVPKRSVGDDDGSRIEILWHTDHCGMRKIRRISSAIKARGKLKAGRKTPRHRRSVFIYLYRTPCCANSSPIPGARATAQHENARQGPA